MKSNEKKYTSIDQLPLVLSVGDPAHVLGIWN